MPMQFAMHTWPRNGRTIMRSNKDLSISEFLAAQNIKRAMIYKDDPDMVSKYLKIALGELYQ